MWISKEFICGLLFIYVFVATGFIGFYAYDEHIIKYYNQTICNNLYEYTGDYIACTNRYIGYNIQDIKLTYKKGENACLYKKENR